MRRVAHAFHAAGDDEVGIAGLDRLGREHDPLEPGAAHLVHGEGGDGIGESGEERRLPGRRLAHPGLHHVPHDDFIDLCGLHVGPPDRLGNGDGPELRRRNVGQLAEELPDRGANGREKEGIHDGFTAEGAEIADKPLHYSISAISAPSAVNAALCPGRSSSPRT